ncbi:MAG: LD-carboxypeptidase [Deltaproteobacteria bacterium]|nr:LD-carboxypeptidase [Deltaproteobacteria bacterium]
MNPIHPKAVIPGDRIAVVAPAGPVEPEAFQAGISRLSRHYRPIWDAECLEREGFLAGSDERRLVELQEALDNPDVRAVFAARGGWGVSRILDRLNLSGLVRKPKWIVGSSDLTALLIQLWGMHRMRAIHGPMVFRFGQTHRDDLIALVDLLEGRPWSPPSGLVPVFPGEARGPLIGGNLTILAHLVGTVPDDFARDAILFIEDVGEAAYRLDRSVTQLVRAGVLKGIRGVVLGAFTDCAPGPDGCPAATVVSKSFQAARIPVVSGYPAAHGERNYPFVHGAEVILEVRDNTAVLTRA